MRQGHLSLSPCLFPLLPQPRPPAWAFAVAGTGSRTVTPCPVLLRRLDDGCPLALRLTPPIGLGVWAAPFLKRDTETSSPAPALGREQGAMRAEAWACASVGRSLAPSSSTGALTCEAAVSNQT